MPRTLVEIPVDVLKKLDHLAIQEKLSRSELIRRAAELLLHSSDEKASRDVFGILKEFGTFNSVQRVNSKRNKVTVGEEVENDHRETL